MQYNYKYRLTPAESTHEELLRHVDICRQLYNHCLYELNESEDSTPARYDIQSKLPSLKEWWTELKDVHSKVLQMVVKRVYDNLSALNAQKERGHIVGMLTWKRPRDYRSLTYNQTGFELKNTSGRPTLWLSKIGKVPIQLHRKLPDDAAIKQVTVKREPTGDWFAVFGIKTSKDTPPKPENPECLVGIDLGILKYACDTEGFAIESLDLSDARRRLEREQRKLSRKEHGSNNWEKQRKTVAHRYADMKRKRRDFLHKLSAYYAREYDLVAVENLDVKGLMELPSNSRNRVSAAWGTFLRMLEYKCEREGAHFIAVDPQGTTKECSRCGVSVDKPLRVREHSCPSCGLACDRDLNAAWNILLRGLKKANIGVDHSELMPVETALPTGTTSVPAKRVIESGSPDLKERARAKSRSG